MQKIYARGMAKELYCERETIDKLFPLIDDHVEYVSAFVQKLTERQQSNKVIINLIRTIFRSYQLYLAKDVCRHL